MAGNFDILLEKLDRFIRRYYLNLLIKGSLLFGAGFLVLFLVFSLLEYFGYFGTGVRFVLFYGFLLFNVFVLIRYVARPLAGFLKIGKRIDTADAAQIIGKHFKHEIRDKITNALQLRHYMEENAEGRELIMAGIDQKSSFALKVPFADAIDLKGNKKYLPFFLFPLMLVFGILLVRPAFVVEPASRIAATRCISQSQPRFLLVLKANCRDFRVKILPLMPVARVPFYRRRLRFATVKLNI